MAAASTTDAALALAGFSTGYGDMPVLRAVDVVFPKGAITAIIGPNGAGKSTVLKGAVGLLRAWEGTVRLRGQDVTTMPAHQRVARGMGFVPQGRIVFPSMTVRENLEVGGFAIRNDRARLAANFDYVLGLLPVLKDRARQVAGTMSGGEQQMLAIGRALMTRPDVLLLDEPSLGLSPKMVAVVFDKLVALRGEGLTIGVVEQKASRVLELADGAYVLVNGRNALAGPASALREDERVKRLYLGEVPEDLMDETA